MAHKGKFGPVLFERDLNVPLGSYSYGLASQWRTFFPVMGGGYYAPWGGHFHVSTVGVADYSNGSVLWEYFNPIFPDDVIQVSRRLDLPTVNSITVSRYISNGVTWLQSPGGIGSSTWDFFNGNHWPIWVRIAGPPGFFLPAPDPSVGVLW